MRRNVSRRVASGLGRIGGRRGRVGSCEEEDTRTWVKRAYPHSWIGCILTLLFHANRSLVHASESMTMACLVFSGQWPDLINKWNSLSHDSHAQCVYPPPHVTCKSHDTSESTQCVYPPPHMTFKGHDSSESSQCVYPPHMTCKGHFTSESTVTRVSPVFEGS